MGTLGKLLIFVLLLFLLTPGTATVLAQSTDYAKPIPERVKDAREKAKETFQVKIDERKAERCEVKEKVLTARTTSLTRLVNNILEKFDLIVKRVKNFYTDKGLTVENYDSLLADIDANKAAVDTALASAATNAQAFTCDSDDPKATLTSFREDMQAVKQALQDYRTSIKDLIVAVKQAAESANGEKTETDE